MQWVYMLFNERGSPVSKLKILLLIPVVLWLSGCGSTIPTYDLKVNVVFETRIDGNGSLIPTKDGTQFLCEKSGFAYKDDPTSVAPSVISIMDESWSSADLEIFSSTDNLVGVSDSALPRINDDGSCQVQFVFTNLDLPNAPIKVKTSKFSEWDIPQSQWKTGTVLLNGMGAKF